MKEIQILLKKNVVIICNNEFCYSSLCARGGLYFLCIRHFLTCYLVYVQSFLNFVFLRLSRFRPGSILVTFSFVDNS